MTFTEVTSVAMGVGVLAGGTYHWRKWRAEPAQARTFATYHVTASARLMDALTWCYRHAVCTSARCEPDAERRASHQRRLAGCLLIAVCLASLPVAGVLLSDVGVVGEHAYAFGFAAFAWSVVVEWPAQALRDVQYEPGGEPAQRAAETGLAGRLVVLAACEVAAYAMTGFRVMPEGSQSQAVVLGITLIGLADLVAIATTLWMGVRGGAPLAD